MFSTACAAALAQEGTRQLWNTEFLSQRPPVKQGAAPQKPITYRPVGGAAPGAGPGVMVGVTIWKLRNAMPSEASGARLLILEKAGASRTETVPERIEAGSPLAPGDRVRLTVEAPRGGYLYVIDREQYADGSSSAPYLIYPNFQNRPGDNAVAPGRLIEIPDRHAEPNHFVIRPSRGDQTGELLALLVTTEPLKNLAIGPDPLELNKDEYAAWEKKWAVEAQRFELAGGPGKPWTEKESLAGASRDTRLSQGDAMPQTLYRVTAKPGGSILLKLPLPIRR